MAQEFMVGDRVLEDGDDAGTIMRIADGIILSLIHI